MAIEFPEWITPKQREMLIRAAELFYEHPFTRDERDAPKLVAEMCAISMAIAFGLNTKLSEVLVVATNHSTDDETWKKHVIPLVQQAFDEITANGGKRPEYLRSNEI